ncbi:MAG: sulfatase-like hydrolase/transferase [Ilumatobacteraceae bacterium]|nr:sulfatase-like hydrolase/transferase [Ilumatobacteraceae bacterium]
MTSIGRTVADSTPNWPAAPRPPEGAPNILLVLFDDVGFSDFGCYGGDAATPTIDRLAADGIRYTGFHTTAMCSTTRAALLTGRNHHSVGVGCLANFDSGYPGYRGKIATSAGTVAEMLRPHGYRSYMTGKWHVTPLYETGPTGPTDGWPLARGFDRFYGFLDAETDQYSPELVRDNTHVTAPGTYESGYHLTEDLVDESIRMLAEHRAGSPDTPWFMYVAPGACHAPHQGPKELIDHYDPMFADGWDAARERRLARMIDLGIVPAGTVLPERNARVLPWDELTADERRVAQRLQAAYAAMLDHTDQQLARLVEFLEATDQLDDTLVLVLSDNGASQEGGPLGFVNALGPFNLIHETTETKLARLDDIGGPDTHTNFPWGWAMAANTPLKRYKQNTHGGGIRDPLVVSWPAGIGDHGGLRHQFAHCSDVVPTLLDVIGIEPPTTVRGAAQQPIEGTSFAATLADPAAETGKSVQYFEMFSHRGLWLDGWKAVAYHAPGTPIDDDVWELYHLDEDFNEVHDLAAEHPERLASMIERWWQEAEAHQVLPLDDRFGERFAENAARVHGERTHYEFWAGMGHLASDVAPDVRSRSYRIVAEVEIPDGGAEGVLVAHGDATSGYSLHLAGGHLVHDLNVGGTHHVVRSDQPVAPGRHELGFRMERVDGHGTGTLSVDGVDVGSMATDHSFFTLISFSGLDIGLDRGSPVGHYAAPFEFTGNLRRVVVDMDHDQDVDHEAAGVAQMARE